MISRGMPTFAAMIAVPAVSRRRAAARAPAPLPWPVAALAIGSLSAGLWAGLGWLAMAVF
jgi:hypothetical protein